MTFSSFSSSCSFIGVAVGDAVAVAVGNAIFSASSSKLSSVDGYCVFSSLRLFTLVASADKKKSMPAEGSPFASFANNSKCILENIIAAAAAHAATRPAPFILLFCIITSA